MSIEYASGLLLLGVMYALIRWTRRPLIIHRWARILIFKSNSLAGTHPKLLMDTWSPCIHLLKGCLSERVFGGHRGLRSLKVLHIDLVLDLLEPRIVVVRVQWVSHLPIGDMHRGVPPCVGFYVDIFSFEVVTGP